MSRSESEDEFESADEGDDSSEESSCSSENECIADDEHQSSKKSVTQDEAEANVPSSAEETQEAKTMLEIENNVENLSCQEKSYMTCTMTSEPSNVAIADKSDPITPEMCSQISTLDRKDHEEDEGISSDVLSQTNRPKSDIPFAATENKDHENQEIPAEIITKISTRSISTSGKIRSKPSLGAKKLGAVKLSQPPESLDCTLEKLDSSKSCTTEIKNITSDYQPVKESSNKNDSSGGWGWFAPPKSLISSVSSLTNQILSTMENGLNIPEPEELAKEEASCASIEHTEGDHQIPDPVQEKPTGFTQLFGGVTNLTRFVESTGGSLLSSGLDTLELLGKKTIDVLQQSDPGLKKTKAVLANPLQGSQDRPCLSKILREAKEVNEMVKPDSELASAHQEPPITLTNLFELHSGLAHLEGLEMLSQQCQSRVSSQLRRLPSQRRATVEEIAVLCDLTDDFDDQDTSDSDLLDLQSLEQNISSLFDSINLEVSSAKLMNAFRDSLTDPGKTNSPKENYRFALDSLALVTSLGIELYRKSAERILMAEKPPNPVGVRLEAETFQTITKVLTTEISKLGTYHASLIIRTSTSDQTDFSTDVYYEASNCRSYLQNALKLMTPVLQSRIL